MNSLSRRTLSLVTVSTLGLLAGACSTSSDTLRPVEQSVPVLDTLSPTLPEPQNPNTLAPIVAPPIPSIGQQPLPPDDGDQGDDEQPERSTTTTTRPRQSTTTTTIPRRATSTTSTTERTEPPRTDPPVTEPPAPTEPVLTEPPATDPPVTEPPATEPPATEPPATEPPATEPPVTEPPATEPPVTEPPVTEPPVTEPPVTEPPVTEPPVTTPPVDQTLTRSNMVGVGFGTSSDESLAAFAAALGEPTSQTELQFPDDLGGGEFRSEDGASLFTAKNATVVCYANGQCAVFGGRRSDLGRQDLMGWTVSQPGLQSDSGVQVGDTMDRYEAEITGGSCEGLATARIDKLDLRLTGPGMISGDTPRDQITIVVISSGDVPVPAPCVAPEPPATDPPAETPVATTA